MQIYEIILFALLMTLIVWVRRCKRQEREKQMLNEELERYFSDVAAAFGKTGTVQEALCEVQEQEKGMRNGQETEAFPEMEKNHSVRMFRLLCRITEEYGDIQKKGTSVFLQSLRNMKEELRETILLARERKYLFSGLGMLCVLPFFFAPFLELWMEHVTEEVAVYGQGGYAVFSTVLAFVATAVCYLLVSRMQLSGMAWGNAYCMETFLLERRWVSALVDRYINRHYTRCLRKNEQLKAVQGCGNIRAFLVRKMLFGVFGVIFTMIFLCCCLNAERKQIVQNISLPVSAVFFMEEDAKERAGEIVREAFCDAVAGVAWEEVENELRQSLVMNTALDSDSLEKTIEMIKELLIKYNSLHLKWYVFLLLFAEGIALTKVPELILRLQRWELRERAAEESLRLQTAVLLLVPYEQTTTEELLDGMEQFAEVFREAVGRAVDTFSWKRKAAINELKEELADEPMRRICDGLLACEELPIRQAFASLEGERRYFLRQNSEECRNIQREKAAVAKIAAYVPFLVVLAVKLILPFVAEGLSELHQYSQWIINAY